MITAVNICGIPYNISYVEDLFDEGTHLGQITYSKGEILINKNMPQPIINESICHEIIHGILFHIGQDELANNEQFVQALGNAVNQSFNIKNIGCECHANK